MNHMKRKLFAEAIICLMIAMLFAGCGKSKVTESDINDKPDTLNENADADGGADSAVEEMSGEKPDRTDEETEKAEKSVSDFDFSGAFEEGRVYNNGTGDPLEGLVSNDILTEFRESNPVEHSDSIKDEANALGKWVQKNISSIPKSIREKGEAIGRHYEFWFGTDVGNNFDGNFPIIYSTYYSLKDYYTSDGKRSSDFYDDVMEENEFLGNGDPENIKRMYSDMQEFITDCNNFIRSK